MSSSSAFEKQLEMLQLRESHKVYSRAKIRANQISVNAACLCFEKSQRENEVITPPKKPRDIPPEVAAHILEFLGGRILPEDHITGHRAAHTHAPPPHERLARKILGLRVGWELKKAASGPHTRSQSSQTPPPSRSWFSLLSCPHRHRSNEDDPPPATVDRAKYKLYLPGCYVDGSDGYHHRVPRGVHRGDLDVVEYCNLSGVVCYRPLSAMTTGRGFEQSSRSWYNFWFDERQLRRDRGDRVHNYTEANVRISGPECGEAGGYIPVLADQEYFHPNALRHLWAGVGTSVHFDLGGAYTKRSAFDAGIFRVRLGNIPASRRRAPSTFFSDFIEPCRRLFIAEGLRRSRVIVRHCIAQLAGALEVDCQPETGSSMLFRAIEYTIVLEGAAAAAIIRDRERAHPAARRRHAHRQPDWDEERWLTGRRFLEYCEKKSAPSDRAALVEFNWQWKCGKAREYPEDPARLDAVQTEEAAVWFRSRGAAASAREDFLDAAKVLNVPIFSTRWRYRAQVLQDAGPEDDARFELEDGHLDLIMNLGSRRLEVLPRRILPGMPWD